MKKILLLLLFPAFTNAQQMSCCTQSTTEQFNTLASTEVFAAAHAAPIPFHFVEEKGTMITYNCADGTEGNAFEVKAAKASNIWLFVFHEWWGLNDYIKREVEKLSDELPNVNIIAIDLYDGKVAETPEVAQETMQALKDERARAIINGAFKYAGKKAKIGTIGWCFGGGWSMQASLMAGKQAIACVMYYGMPEEDIKKLKKLNTDVLGIFASNDKWITPEVVATFKKNMLAADKKLTVKSYKMDHAFANPSNPNYDKVSADNAHKVALSFLKIRLK